MLARENYLKLGFQLFAQNWETPFAELDLIFQEQMSDQLTMVVVEVKRIRRSEMRDRWISPRQLGRLKQAVLWLGQKHPSVRLELCLVDEIDRVERIPFEEF